MEYKVGQKYTIRVDNPFADAEETFILTLTEITNTKIYCNYKYLEPRDEGEGSTDYYIKIFDEIISDSINKVDGWELLDFIDIYDITLPEELFTI